MEKCMRICMWLCACDWANEWMQRFFFLSSFALCLYDAWSWNDWRRCIRSRRHFGNCAIDVDWIAFDGKLIKSFIRAILVHSVTKQQQKLDESTDRRKNE